MAWKILILAGNRVRDRFPREITESLEYLVDSSVNLDQMFQFMESRHYDLLFLELDKLPSDRELLYQTIRDKNPGMKIIVVSSGLGGQKVKQAMDAGVYGCIQEPFQEKEIVTMVHDSLSIEKGGRTSRYS